MINSLLLGVTFGEWISTWYNIIAIILIVIGIALYILSKRLTMVIKKTSTVEPNDKMLVTIRVIGLVIFVIGIILFCLPPKGLE